jgi:hypothetical protein
VDLNLAHAPFFWNWSDLKSKQKKKRASEYFTKNVQKYNTWVGWEELSEKENKQNGIYKILDSNFN